MQFLLRSSNVPRRSLLLLLSLRSLASGLHANVASPLLQQSLHAAHGRSAVTIHPNGSSLVEQSQDRMDASAGERFAVSFSDEVIRHQEARRGELASTATSAAMLQLRTSLPVQARHDLGWLATVLCLSAGTLVYAFFRREHAKTVTKHRLPFQNIGPADADKSSPDLFQRGYTRHWPGHILYCMWILLPVAGYIHLTLLTLDSYDLQLHHPDLTWVQDAEPFLVIFAITHAVMCLESMYLAEARVFFMKPSSLAEATRILVENPEDLTSNTLLDVQEDPATGARYLEFTCLRYLWSQEDGRYTPVGVDQSLTSAEAVRRAQAGGLSHKEVAERISTGPNVINVEVPSIPGSLVNEFFHPIYCFQFSCVWMYYYYTSWNIASIWLFLVVTSGLVKSLVIVRRNQLYVRDLAQSHGTVSVCVQRGSQWRMRPSSEVVPGDIVRIDEGEVVCDLAIVHGGAVVNESMLTGEPMPVQRFPVDPTDKSGQLSSSKHRKHFIFAGTTVMQSAGPEESRAVGVAVSTGARTAKGDLVRMVLFPSSSRFKFTDDLQKVYAIMFLYICVLFCVSLATPQHHWTLVALTGLCILAQGLNPNLPVSLAAAQAVYAGRLADTTGVKCLAPQRMPIAGKVHVMVMDKTGTITKDGMDFAGVRPTQPRGSLFSGHANFLEMESSSGSGTMADSALATEIKWALASCHTVTKLRDGTHVGNLVECSMLEASGWSLADDSKSVHCGSTGQQLEMLKPLEFDHHRMTSGHIVRSGSRVMIFVKGSYETIHGLSLGDTVPPNYKEVTEHYAKEQYYVLAVGMKDLKKPSELEGDRDSLEKGLKLLGLLLFRNELKPDSADAMAHLAEGGVRRIICTGDNALTAAAIGKSCKLFSNSQVILGEKSESANEVRWLRLPENAVVSHEEVLACEEDEFELIVTRDAFSVLRATEDIERLLKKIRVYARMKPMDKVSVIELHQNAGWIVGMCGDGGNDCGALRAAHIGLALSEAEASIVAPFSSSAEYGTGSKSLMSLVHLVRFGRATLCTNLATYSYFMVYGLTLPGAKLTAVFWGNTMLGEWEFIFIDIVLGTFMVFCMTLSWPVENLAGRRPTASLLGVRTVSSVLFQALVFLFIFSLSLYLLTTQDFYLSYDPVDDYELPGEEWTKKPDNYHTPIIFLCLVTQLATAGYCYSFGGEHRQAVYKNIGLTCVYVFILFIIIFLLLGGPTDFHCLFRINCDSSTSRSMDIPVAAQMSVGNIGGCFLGPQYKHWAKKLGASFRFPNNRHGHRCKPAPHIDLEQEIRIHSGAVLWGASHCLGANNCYSKGFRFLFSQLLSLQVVLSLVGNYLLMSWHPGQKLHFKSL